MEMRKFIIELHSDGSMTWVEYTEPRSKEDMEYLCGEAYRKACEYLDTYPARLWTPEVKASFLNGASHIMNLLRRVL